MYGKHFSSTYTGSMYGAGATVFAVWGYVIANTQEGQIELNPRMLASVLGAKENEVREAIEFLCLPDPNSRSKKEDGKRLIREGEFAYRVPTFFDYRSLKDETQRREYLRVKKAESRARLKAKKSTDVKRDSQQPSTYTETDTDTEAEVKIKSKEGGILSKPNGKSNPPPSPKYTQSDFDERDIRNLCRAEKEIMFRLGARIGGEPVTDQEFFTAACEEAGITVERGKKLKEMQRRWE